MRKLRLGFIICWFAVNAVAQNNFVYTNDSWFPNTVSAFRVNADGSLALIEGSPFLTGGNGGGGDVNPGKITIATVKGKGFLYAANNGSTTIAAFRINADTGQLVAVPGSPFPAGTPNSNSTLTLATGPKGHFLFSADETTTSVRVFAISAETGALTEAPGSPFDVGAQPEGLKVSPRRAFLVVGLKSMNSVGVFAIGPNGELTPVPGSPFPASGPAAAVDINCASNRVFVASAGLNTIDVYSMTHEGFLAPVPGSPFDSGGASTINALTLTPDNQNLLTSNVFNSAVSSLSIAPDGTLQPAPGSPFSADDWVGGIATTQTGNFVYASLFAVGKVDGWSIAPGGILTPVPGRPFVTGQSGAGVQSLTTFPAPVCQRGGRQ